MAGRFSNTEVTIGACEICLGGDTEVGVRLQGVKERVGGKNVEVFGII